MTQTMVEAITDRPKELSMETGIKVPETNGLIRILLVEDESLYARMMMQLMAASTANIKTIHVNCLTDALDHLTMEMTDIVLLDLTLPESGGLDTLDRIRAAAPQVPVVVITGGGSELAGEALQHGAQDYLCKGQDEGMVVRSVRYAVERHRANEALAQSQASLRSTRMQLLQIDKMDSIGRLAAGIAHEVRNPLSTIQMGISFLKNFGDDFNEDIMDTVEELEGASERVFQIIHGVLDFCVPTELNLESASINTCICQIMPMFRHEIRTHGIQFVPELNGNIPDLMLDKNQIKQALLHLLLNAVDAMPSGGRLTITTACAPVADVVDDTTPAGSTSRAVLVYIDDTGEGIKEEALPNVFDPFFTTKPVGSGTGLGLSITKNIVELHGGRVSLANHENGGRACMMFIV